MGEAQLDIEPIRPEAPQKRKLPSWLLPVVGALGMLSFARWFKLFDEQGIAIQILMFVTFGSIAGYVLSFMESLEHRTGEAKPNPLITKLLLALSVLIFWIPVGGLAVVSYAIYRTRWDEWNHLIMFPICCLFMLSLGITIVTAMIVSMDMAGVK